MLSVPAIRQPGASPAPSIYTMAEEGDAQGESSGPPAQPAGAPQSLATTEASAPPDKHQMPSGHDSAEQSPNDVHSETTTNNRSRSDLADFAHTAHTSRASTMFSRATQTDVDQSTQTDESFFRHSALGSTATTTAAEKTPQGSSKDVEALPPEDPAPPPPPPSAPQPKPPKPLLGWRLVVVEFCLCLGLLLSIVDASIVATALVPIEYYFNEFFESIWVVLSYLLAYMAFSLLWARFSDIMGRKWMVVSAWIIFTAFSLGCGLATSLEQLIAFRALQGIGGSGLYSLCNVLIPEITPRKHFATMSAATGVVFAISSVLGPVLGGVIASNSTWRWIFLLNVPCGVVATVVLLFAWPSPLNPWPSHWVMVKALLHHVDFVGTTLLLAFTVLLIYGLEEAGAAKYDWSSPVIISTLAAAGASFVALMIWTALLSFTRGKIPINPILPVQLLSHRILAAAFLSTLLTGFPLFLTIIALPERFQIVNGLSATDAGIRLMPLLFASAFGSTIGGLLSRKRNRTFLTLFSASCLMVLGCGLLSTASEGLAIENALYGYQVLFGFGLGMTFTSVTIIASTESKFADYATSLGVVNQARIFGGTIGLAASTIILNVRLWNDLRPLMSYEQLTGLRQSLSYIPLLSPQQQAAVAQAFAASFDDQMRYCTYVAAACVIISLFTFSRNPTDLEARKKLGEALLAGRVSLVDADRELGHLRRPMFAMMGVRDPQPA